MESLKESLLGLRQRNYWNNHFVSEIDLYALMSEELIRKALLDCDLPPNNLPETVKTVCAGLRKIFAILILNGDAKLVTKFIAFDQLQRTELDKKLPLHLDELCLVLPKTRPYRLELFLERQWEFLPPIFSGKLISRCLAPQTIFPITRDEKIGSGGFGDVFEIEISKDYCDFPIYGPGTVCEASLLLHDYVLLIYC
jgi:hypothetical protein